MICDKCSGKVNSDKKCSLCGYDNSNIIISRESQEYEGKSGFYRSTRLTVFLWILIVLDIIGILLVLGNLSAGELPAAYSVIYYISIGLGAFEIILCVFMFKMKRWALNSYIGLNVILGILQLISLNIFGILFKALLLYFVFNNDWEYFE